MRPAIRRKAKEGGTNECESCQEIWRKFKEQREKN